MQMNAESPIMSSCFLVLREREEIEQLYLGRASNVVGI